MAISCQVLLGPSVRLIVLPCFPIGCAARPEVAETEYFEESRNLGIFLSIVSQKALLTENEQFDSEEGKLHLAWNFSSRLPSNSRLGVSGKSQSCTATPRRSGSCGRSEAGAPITPRISALLRRA